MKFDRAWTHKREHQTLSRRLVGASGAAFRAEVLPLVRVALHETALLWQPAPCADLGEEQIAWWCDEEAPLITACLAFDQPQLGETEIERVVAAIRDLASSSRWTDLYLVIHNSAIPSREAREEIEVQLQGLVATGRAQRAEMWDRQSLLHRAFNGMLRHTWEALRRTDLSTAPLADLSSLAGFSPLEEVPCALSRLQFNQYQLLETVSEDQELLDPAKAILDPKAERLTLITGEFGLGKTTAAARAVAQESRPILYVAAARISKDTHSTKDFVSQCFDLERLLAPFSEAASSTLELLVRPILEYLLQDPSSQTLIVLDGLDESAFLARRGGFQSLFNILHEVGSPIVLTLRTAFWDRGVESFAEAFGKPSENGEKRQRRIQRIDLRPWDDDRIRELIQRFQRVSSDRAASDRLEELGAMLDRGDLNQHYGDIPRWPFFLRLLVDTVAEEGLPADGTGRARLLHGWARRKLLRDIQAPIAAGGAGRLPLGPERVSDLGALEIAWEVMLQAAAAMTEPGEEERLALSADCMWEDVRTSSPQLAGLTDPLGVFLNTLLLPARPILLGLPSRVRFAHRSFQEFFLAWFALLHPEKIDIQALPGTVRDWMQRIGAEGLLPLPAVISAQRPRRQTPEPSRSIGPSPMSTTKPAPPDLEIRVKVVPSFGQLKLSYTLHSPNGVAPFVHQEIAGPTLLGDPEALHRSFLQRIEGLGRGLEVGGELVLRNEAKRKFEGIGRELWRQLISDEMRQAYRRFRETVHSLLIISDEPWIPWEMVKPFDSGPEPLDDPFFAERFEVTRWFSGTRSLPSDLHVQALTCVTGLGGLPLEEPERALVTGLATGVVRDRTPRPPSASNLIQLLEKGGLGLLHFVQHGTFDSANPNEAGLPLADGSVFRPSDLHGDVQSQIGRDRPLVFLNLCDSGRQAWTWSGLGGWADRWVQVCGCGAFVGPLWPVLDIAAFAFAESFYGALAEGAPLGQAARRGRLAARDSAPGDPSWLAYSVYGHPNARLRLGTRPSEPSEPSEPSKGRENTRVSAESQSAYVPIHRKTIETWRLNEDPLQQGSSPRPLNPEAPPPSLPAGKSTASPNLRIRKKFTDRERDQFVEDAFEALAESFESSLAQLAAKNQEVETTFRRIDREHFSAAIYVQGKKERSCRIWLSRSFLHGIAYYEKDSGEDNAYHQILSVENDGYSLWFKASMDISGHAPAKMSPAEAAEFLWSALIQPLQ